MNRRIIMYVPTATKATFRASTFKTVVSCKARSNGNLRIPVFAERPGDIMRWIKDKKAILK